MTTGVWVVVVKEVVAFVIPFEETMDILMEICKG